MAKLARLNSYAKLCDVRLKLQSPLFQGRFRGIFAGSVQAQDPLTPLKRG